MSTNSVVVIGRGRMGQAYAQRLRDQGIDSLALEPAEWKAQPIQSCDCLLLALRSGADTVKFIAELIETEATILDLTTQGLQETRSCVARARSKGLSYVGGVLRVRQLTRPRAIGGVQPYQGRRPRRCCIVRLLPQAG